MKIMNYNILHGFHTNEQPFVLQKDRLKAAQETVKRENPDVLVLTEACFGNKNKYGIIMDYKKLFGFPHTAYSVTASEWGSSLLSRYPIISSEDYSMDRRSFFRNCLSVDGEKIWVDVAHPHPDVSEFEKRRFFHSQLRDMPLNVPYILAGDFNAISDEDAYNKKKLVQGFARFMKNEGDAKKIIESFMTYQAIPEIRAHGLTDTYRQIHKDTNYTVPTDYCSLDKRSGVRIDYIFCSPHFKVEDARIVQDKDTNKASDHFPVVAELKLKKLKK